MSLFGKIFPGYNTYWMAVWMIIATAALLCLAIYRLARGDLRDTLSSALSALVILIILSAQRNVGSVKATRGLPKAEQPARFEHLANDMSRWVWSALIVALALLILAVIFWMERRGAYDVAWGLLLASCSVSVLGVAIDYEEWRRITVLRAHGSYDTFRFAESLHYALTIGTVGLALAGVIGLVLAYRRSR